MYCGVEDRATSLVGAMHATRVLLQGGADLAALDLASNQPVPEILPDPEEAPKPPLSQPKPPLNKPYGGQDAEPVMPRRSSDILRDRVTNMSGQLTSMVNTFAKDPKASIKGSPQAAQSLLKGLFQRQSRTPRTESQSRVRDTTNAGDSSAQPSSRQSLDGSEAAAGGLCAQDLSPD